MAGIDQLPTDAALIVIDVQKGFDDPSRGRRNNPGAEANISRLLDAWRRTQRPIYFIQHQSRNPLSTLRPNYVGSEIKDEVRPGEDEPVLQKSVHSAFIGTDLEARLRAAGQSTVVITGLVTDHCVSTTARTASDLGFTTVVVSDASATFDRTNYNGVHFAAEDVHQSALASLHGEFGTVTDTQSVIESLGEPAAPGA